VAHHGVGVVRSTDNGNNWLDASRGMTDPNVWSLALNSNGELFAGNSQGVVLHSGDNGGNWQQVGESDSNHPIFDLAINRSGDLFVAAGNAGVFRIYKGSVKHWMRTRIQLANSDVRALGINHNGDIFAGTFGEGVFRSTDNGESWTAVNDGLTSLRIAAFAFNPRGVAFAGTPDGVFRYHYRNSTWIRADSGLTNSDVTVLINYDMGHFFAGTGSGVFRSTDYGRSWSELNTGLSNVAVYSLVLGFDGQIYAGTTSALFRSTIPDAAQPEHAEARPTDESIRQTREDAAPPTSKTPRLSISKILEQAKLPEAAPLAPGNLPNPVVEYKSYQSRKINGQEIVKYNLSVSNCGQYPNFLFEPVPGLPPCGNIPNASRIMVEIFDWNRNRLNLLCNITTTKELERIWFEIDRSLARTEQKVRIVLTDRWSHKAWESAWVKVPKYQVID